MIKVYEDEYGMFAIPDDAAAVIDRVEQRINNASLWLRLKRWLRLRGSVKLDEVEIRFYLKDQRKAFRQAFMEGRQADEWRAQTWAEWKRWLKQGGGE